MNAVSEMVQSFSALLRSGQLPQLGDWSYLILAVLVAVEGPVATLLGAVAASTGMMRPVPVFVAASAGNLTADSLWYGLGYLGKIDWLFGFGKRLGVRRELLEKMQKAMRQHVTKVLFLAKLSVSLVIPSLITAGLVKAPWRRWFPAVFGAEMIWTGSLVLIGYYAAEAMKQVEKGMAYFILFASALFLLFIFGLARRVFHEVSHESEA